MQFHDIGPDADGVISFVTVDVKQRFHNPFLVALQALVGDNIWKDYDSDSGNLIPKFYSFEEIIKSEPTSRQQIAVDWLISRAAIIDETVALWKYDYPVDFANQHRDAGWVSAFAQSYIAMAMLYFFFATGDEKYKKYCLYAVEGLCLPEAKGGCANWMTRKKVWFEEIPGDNHTHIFNAHMVSLVVLNMVSKYLRTKNYCSYIEAGMRALKYELPLMDTGTLSAYDISPKLSLKLKIEFGDLNNDSKISIKTIGIKNKFEKRSIELTDERCFDEGLNYVSGNNWTSAVDSKGYRKVIAEKDANNSNIYCYFDDVKSASKYVNLHINYYCDMNSHVLVKKLTSQGYVEIGGDCNKKISKGFHRVKIKIPAHFLYEDVSKVYHDYHVRLLYELLKYSYDKGIAQYYKKFSKIDFFPQADIIDGIEFVPFSGNACNLLVRTAIRQAALRNKIYISFVRTLPDDFISKDSVVLSKLIEGTESLNDLYDNAPFIMQLDRCSNFDESFRQSLEKVYGYLCGDDSLKNCDDVVKWVQLYGERKNFKVKEGKFTVNTVNSSETDTYLELFAIQKEKEKEMNNATFTLLDTIPCEISTIADIGAGPGLVNQYISHMFQVLAVDIDEKILVQNKCHTCLGDILDMPLEDDSVDMSISCDVLEHIPESLLDKAVSEMKRVSRKYFYIQVPNEEILRYSMAHCPNCGHVWHVNHHKNRFDLERLKKYQDERWKIVRINYTGEIYNEKDNPVLYEAIDETVFRVNGFSCPICGTKSKEQNIEELNRLEAEDNPRFRNLSVSPKYTEIGCLFEFSTTNYDANIENKYYKYVCNCQEIDFTKGFFKKGSYSGKEHIPFAILEEKCVITKEGVLLFGNTNITAFFPEVPSGSVISVCGKSNTKASLICCTYHDNEYEEYSCELSNGEFSVSYQRKEEAASFVRVYVVGEAIISSVNITTNTNSKRNYDFIVSQDTVRTHYKKMDKEFYLITDDGTAFEVD